MRKKNKKNSLSRFKGVVIKSLSKGVFVLVENKELFISSKNSLFALEGDVVLVSKSLKRKKPEITKVVKRCRDEFVGVLDFSSSFCFFIADDRSVYFDIFLPKEKNLSTSLVDKKVLVKVDDWPKNKKNPSGFVMRELGFCGAVSSEVSSIINQYGLPSSFPKKVLEASLYDLESTISSCLSQRRDFRKTTTFTIDPENAKDFDDAISFKEIKNGIYEIGVHISDVAFFVKEGSLVDQEAKKRSTSFYLGNRVVPMLPENISNNICSLTPNEDRLAFSVVFLFDSLGSIVDYSICESIIHSDKRFSYNEASDILKNGKGLFFKELFALNSIAKKLRKKRILSGSIDFEREDPVFSFNSSGFVSSVDVKKPLDPHRLVEDFMLLTNKTIAEHLKKNKTPCIYRIHPGPDEKKLLEIFNLAKEMDCVSRKPKKLSSSVFLNSLIKHPDLNKKSLFEVLVLRSMAKAAYDKINIGHYGLGFENYCHFTSPIRRYADLVVHRLLKNLLFNRPFSSVSSISSISSYCSKKEQLATSAERSLRRRLEVSFLKSKKGGFFKGVVSSVVEWGMYVSLVENKCEGLVRINTIKEDVFFYDPSSFSLLGKNTKKKYQLGDIVTIQVGSFSFNSRSAEFILL